MTRTQAYDQHLNMILGDVEETITTVEIDDETYEEIIKVLLGRRSDWGEGCKVGAMFFDCPTPHLLRNDVLRMLGLAYRGGGLCLCSVWRLGAPQCLATGSLCCYIQQPTSCLQCNHLLPSLHKTT